MSGGSGVDVWRREVPAHPCDDFTRSGHGRYEQQHVASEVSYSLYSSRVEAAASYRCAPTLYHERSRIQEHRPRLDSRPSWSHEPGDNMTFPVVLDSKNSTVVGNSACSGVASNPVYEKMLEIVTTPVEKLQSPSGSGRAQPMEVADCRASQVPGQFDRYGSPPALPGPLVAPPGQLVAGQSDECATLDERVATSNDQVSMEVTHPVTSPPASLHLVAAYQEQRQPVTDAAEIVAVQTESPSHQPVHAVPTGAPPIHHTRSPRPIDYTEAILGHASECKDSRCHLTDCHRMKEEIAHCLHHDLLKQYKQCDRCTAIGGVCLYHFRVCPVPFCCFFLCRTLKARLKGSCVPLSQAMDVSVNRRFRLDRVHPDNIIYKGPSCAFQGQSFVEDVHYTILTPKVVGRGQNGDVCEVELLKPIVHNGVQHQVKGICMKKCKYRGEEIEVVRRLMSHLNVVQTHLIIRCNDQMLVFMPKLDCSLYAWKSQLVKEQRNLSMDDLKRVESDVASGLSYMHGMGIVHRDIKAANLLLQDGRVKICDFGHAKHIGLGGIATPCPTCGTQGYRAPEIVKSEPHGFKVDIYALGITLLHLALPFDWETRWPQDRAKGTCILEYMPVIGNKIALCCHGDATQRPSAVQLLALASRVL